MSSFQQDSLQVSENYYGGNALVSKEEYQEACQKLISFLGYSLTCDCSSIFIDRSTFQDLDKIN